MRISVLSRLCCCALLASTSLVYAQIAPPTTPTPTPAVAPAPAHTVTKSFDTAADEALSAMRKRAGELGVGGVAVVAYFEGDTIESWTSKMVVVGRHKDEPSADAKGANLLGIAYAKAAEMADTLKDSGTANRPPMTGEFGWTGGVIVRSGTGWVVSAFSGGKGEDDVKVSKAGAEALKASESFQVPK